MIDRDKNKSARAAPRESSSASIDQRYRWLWTMALVCAAVVFFVLAIPMLTGRMYVLGDLANYHIPTRRFFAECLKNGNRPEWFPLIFRGYYLHGDGQVGMYHPWHWIIYRTFPLVLAINLEILASYFFLFGGCYLLGRANHFPAFAAAFGATLFTFCGFNLLHLHHVNMVAVVAHLPWLLLTIEMVFCSNNDRHVIWSQFVLALLIGSMLLLGHPQATWLCGLIALVFTCYWMSRRASMLRLFSVAQSVVLGLLIGSVQWWETWSLLGQSQRSDPTPDFLGIGSLHPANLIQYLAPYLFHYRVLDHEMGDNATHELGLYVGAVVPVLFIWGLLRWRRTNEFRALRWGAVALVAIGLGLSLGKFVPLLHGLVLRLPVVGLFRSPARYSLLADAGLAILATIGFADLANVALKGQKFSIRWLIVLFAAPVGGLAALILVAIFGTQSAAGFDWRLASASSGCGGLILSVAAAGLTIAAARGSYPALFGLVLLSAGDLSIYGISHARTSPPLTYDELLSIAPFFSPDPAMRVEVLPPSDLATLFRQRMFSGYVGLTPDSPWTEDYNWLSQHFQQVMELTSVQTVLNGGQEIRVPKPLPRARLVTQTVVSQDIRKTLPQIDCATTALVDQSVSLDPGSPGTAVIDVDLPGKITVSTKAGGTQLLVVSEHAQPGWSVRINGKPAAVHRVYGDLLACVVPAGASRVAFAFNPASLAMTRRISLLALLAATVSCGLGLFFLRRKPQ